MDELDHRHRINDGFGSKHDTATIFPQFQLGNTQCSGLQLQLSDCKQMFSSVWKHTKTVNHFHIQLTQRIAVTGRGNPFVECQTGMHIGQIILWDQRGYVQIHLRATFFLTCIKIWQFTLLDAAHRALKQLGI